MPYQRVFESVEKGHGRIDIRKITVLPGCPMVHKFPGAKQIFSIERIRQDLAGAPLTSDISYCITSLNHKKAGAERLLEMNRGHWHIENKLHYIRDVTFKEDSSRIRTGNGAHAMAILKNLTIKTKPRPEGRGCKMPPRGRPS